MYSQYRYIKGRGVVAINFPEYPDGFSKLKRILYVGCGYDNDGLEALAKNHEYVVGIDKYLCDRQKDIKEREELTASYSNLHIKVMDARKLIFPDQSFDGIVFKRSLTHIGNEKDIKEALGEAHRVLCEERMVWVIYSQHDIDFSLEKIKILLSSSNFEAISETEGYIVCTK